MFLSFPKAKLWVQIDDLVQQWLNKANLKKESNVMHWGIVHGFWLLPSLFWLVVMALLIWGAIRWFNRSNRLHAYYPGTSHPGTPPTRLSALEILRQRYARGEIDEITFNQMRERLQGSDGPKYE